jgi:uroporphyrinogen-III synthase
MSITIVRAESGRELLADTLRSRGAEVNYLAAYERQTHLPDAGEREALENAFRDGSVQCLSVMSVDSLRNFLQIMPASCHEQLRKTLLVAPSDRVIQTAKEIIPGVATSLAPGPQVTDMVNTLIAYRQSGQSE